MAAVLRLGTAASGAAGRPAGHDFEFGVRGLRFRGLGAYGLGV